MHEHLAKHDRPGTVLAWLHKPTAPAILNELDGGGQPLTHGTLDELPDGKPLRHRLVILTRY